MKTLVSGVFKWIITLMLSLILFTIMFGTTSRQFFWANLEPTYKQIWLSYTFNDGKDIDQVYQANFDAAVSAKE